jgi:hypothetical protein
VALLPNYWGSSLAAWFQNLFPPPPPSSIKDRVPVSLSTAKKWHLEQFPNSKSLLPIPHPLSSRLNSWAPPRNPSFLYSFSRFNKKKERKPWREGFFPWREALPPSLHFPRRPLLLLADDGCNCNLLDEMATTRPERTTESWAAVARIGRR